MVSYFPFLIHRLESVWGETANEFDPSRWDLDKVGREEIERLSLIHI